MEFIATPEQAKIIEAEIVGQKVTACAGSGKTATAVRRVIEVRRQLSESRGYVALLSYSKCGCRYLPQGICGIDRQYPENFETSLYRHG